MEKLRQLQKQVFRSKSTLAVVIGLALAILAASIWWAQRLVRERIRDQIAGRDGEILHALALMQEYDDQADEEMVAPLEDPTEQFNLLMKISRLKGVLGLRLFSPQGEFVHAFPAYISETALDRQDLAPLQALRPVSHFFPHGRLEDYDLLAEGGGAPVPLLVVNVPIHGPDQARLLGVAQFILQGESIARQYAELDRNLRLEAAVAFLSGGGLLALALVAGFRRVQRANRLLAERTGHLLQANRELALAAKTSAVGAVTSYLIHGLKNPLSGLHSFVHSHSANQTPTDDTDWQEALATTRRMQDLINRVVQVLKEQDTAGLYEISLAELVEMVAGKMQPVARARGVRFATSLEAEATLTNRESNLLLLILENLIENALEATPPGRSVRLCVAGDGERILVAVEDEGPGLPEGMRERLFSPCRSSKPGGSGIGLALSRQLALHLGATLELKRNSSAGCVFQLALPRPASADAPPSAAVAAGAFD